LRHPSTAIHLPKDGKSEDALEIVLEDSGAAVNPDKMLRARARRCKAGGLGLHFIRQSMDTVEFTHSNGRNQLRLVKICMGRRPRKAPEEN